MVAWRYQGANTMPEYFREFFDVYIQSLAIMRDRQDANIAVNEGILFFKVSE